MKKVLIASLALAFAIGLGNAGAASRDYISIVGSSTVYPFATVVAENFGKTTEFKTPTIESTGSGGGHKLFGAGVGVEYPDITNSSRRIKKSEFEAAAANGVTEIVEVKIGYDGIVIANSNKAPQFKLSRKDIFLALAKDVPSGNVAGKTVPNPNKTWKDVNPELPDIKIEVLGPPPTSGTRDAFVELAMEGGAKKFEWIADLKKKTKRPTKRFATPSVKTVLISRPAKMTTSIVQKLDTNPDALGISGFPFWIRIRISFRDPWWTEWLRNLTQLPTAAIRFPGPCFLREKSPCGQHSRYPGVFGRIHQRKSLGQ